MTRLAFAFLIASIATEAQARVCAPHAQMAAELEQKHSETVQMFLVQPNGAILEIRAAEKSRTWTVLNVTPHGMACILGAGTGYVPVKQKSGEPS